MGNNNTKIFNTETEKVKDLGISDGFEYHNGIIANFYNPNPSFGASRVSKILFYNMKGETIQPKLYAKFLVCREGCCTRKRRVNILKVSFHIALMGRHFSII